jgi:hypothetical protein
VSALRHNGAPLLLLLLVGVGALVAAVVIAGTRPSPAITAYAEVSLHPDGCSVEPSRGLNADECQLTPVKGVYRLKFVTSLRESTAVASLGSCCPGSVRASVTGDKEVTLVVPRFTRSEMRASVVLP